MNRKPKVIFSLTFTFSGVMGYVSPQRPLYLSRPWPVETNRHAQLLKESFSIKNNRVPNASREEMSVHQLHQLYSAQWAIH